MPSAGSALTTKIDPNELRQLRGTLRAMKPESPEYTDRFKAANRRAAEVMASQARRNLSSMGGQQNAAADRVQPVNSGVDIKIKVSNTNGVPFALAAVWGMKRRTGWYAADKYARVTGTVRRLARRALGRSTYQGLQHRPWVGAGWAVGTKGEGPYGLNDAIADRLDEAVDGWGEAIDSIMRDTGLRE